MRIALTALAALAIAGSASANGIDFIALIDGDQNDNDSPATGTMTGTFDPDAMSFSFSWDISDNLIGVPQMPGAHIHEGAEGESGPIVFGFADDEWDLTGSATWEDMSQANVDALMAGNLYINFHTTEYPAGEVRGQINKIPAPGAAAIFGLGGLAIARRRR
jgi:hypothetical protein